MALLYQAAFEAGQWGFWCEAYGETALVEQAVSGEKAGTEGDFELMLAHNRKNLVAQLPKTKAFFPLNPPPEGFRESWQIQWVGHIRCWPDLDQREIMLKTCGPDTIIASGPVPGTYGRKTWLNAIDDHPDMFLPLTTCCD